MIDMDAEIAWLDARHCVRVVLSDRSWLWWQIHYAEQDAQDRHEAMTQRHVNTVLRSNPPVGGEREIRVDMAGTGLSMATAQHVRAMLVDAYAKAGWSDVRIRNNVLIMNAPLED